MAGTVSARAAAPARVRADLGVMVWAFLACRGPVRGLSWVSKRGRALASMRRP